jgi:hypothetical protein
VHVDLGLTYEATHQYAKAAEEFDTYLRLAPRSVDAAIIGYEAATVRGFAVKNRQAAEKKQPSLKRP